jgi:quinol monooxygenase YgiN
VDVIVFSLRVVTSGDQRTALIRTLGSVLGPTRVTPGCLDARLYAELDHGKGMVLVEEWESREQFEQHLDEETLKRLVAAIELSSAAPEVRIDTVTREEGVETLIPNPKSRCAVGG